MGGRIKFLGTRVNNEILENLTFDKMEQQHCDTSSSFVSSKAVRIWR